MDIALFIVIIDVLDVFALANIIYKLTLCIFFEKKSYKFYCKFCFVADILFFMSQTKKRRLAYFVFKFLVLRF